MLSPLLLWRWFQVKYLYDPNVIRKADILSIENLKIPGIVLMENAGLEAAISAHRFFPRAKKFLVLAGPGNNGGDGYVIARHLVRWGFSPTVILTAPPEKIKGDARTNLDILAQLNVPMRCSDTMTGEEITLAISENDVILDCLLGTGSRGNPRGEIARIITLLEDKENIIAIDIPSGINAETGEIYSPCVSASLTITMLAMKTGQGVMPAAAHTGYVDVVSIGVPPSSVLPPKANLSIWEEKDSIDLLPKRKCTLHKGGRGTLLIVGGSRHYRGAPLLSAVGALKSGCGIVIVASSNEVCNEGTSFVPEAVFTPLAHENFEELLCWADRGTAAVVGPGLGRDRWSGALIEYMWNNWPHPLLVDGDGLFWLAELRTSLKKRDDVLLTPHEGEAARLLEISSKDIASSRLYAARQLANEWGTVILKGYGTVICTECQSIVVQEGGPELSIPGSGDVLSGIVGTFLAQHFSPLYAASLGAWVHGRAGRNLAQKQGIDGLLSREIAMEIPSILHGLRGGHEKTKS